MENTIATAGVGAYSNARWDRQYTQYVYQSGFVLMGLVHLALYRLCTDMSRKAMWDFGEGEPGSKESERGREGDRSIRCG